ncbi:ADP-ribosylation factor-like protein 9 isoform X1 [Ictidomys tridecemlineatus]|nr:ADP-ribosylation factor-like protein 9 isoform X1 [Ictidomys tridecemlineatus]KAG3276578.1 ADP ribosylation factor like GTPase 9 [Ictidomys tridecemlineatus]
MPDLRLYALGIAAAVVTTGVAYALWTYVSALRPARRPHLPGPEAATPARGRAEERKQTGAVEMENVKKGKTKEVAKEKIKVKGKEERKKEVSKGKEKGKETAAKNEQFKEKPEVEKSDSTKSETPLESSVENQDKNKQILVLGLDGAGKTSILDSLALNKVQHSKAPTQGFNPVCIDIEDNQMEFLEIGGSEPFRSYWEMYLSKGLLLIFVVDSADHNRLPEAKKFLHQLTEANPILPLVVFAHKQDLEAAYHITDIHEALALSEVGNDRKLFLFGTQVTKNGAEIPSTMQDAKDLIAHLAANVQ